MLLRTGLHLTVGLAGLFTDPASAQSWRNLPNLPVQSLQEHTTVAISNTSIITIGGLLPGGPMGQTTNTVLRFDIPSNSWRVVAGAPQALNHPNAAFLDGRIWLLGGLSSSGNWAATGSSWVYTPSSNSWATLPSMPSSARGAAAVGAYGRRIYLAGGIASLSNRPSTTVTAFDIDSRSWLTLPAAAANLPAARDHGAGVVVGSRFYVIGGRDANINDVKSEVYILDLNNLNAGWATSPGRMPTARAGISAAAVGTKIYVFGGEGNRAVSTGVFPQTEVYDTVNNTWTSLSNMRNPRHGTAAAAAGGAIYIPGGGVTQGIGASNIFDVFTP